MNHVFSAKNRQKNKNIQPGLEKQHSYKKKTEVNLCFSHTKNNMTSTILF